MEPNFSFNMTEKSKYRKQILPIKLIQRTIAATLILWKQNKFKPMTTIFKAKMALS